MKFILPFLALLFSGYAFAQNTWKGKVMHADHKEPLAEVTVFIKGTSIIAKTDVAGLVTLQNIPNGLQTISFKIVGHQEKSISLTFPINQTEPQLIELEHDEDDLDEVVITSTRSSRSIKDIPTRVEFIAGEELEEKANMKPGDVRMILSESTGIQTQTTSATSANAAIRIQGLDGRYTQILKDGFPLYAGAASGLGLLQIQPLDLKQVELIKGSASTLYGGGAIAGLVNFISKTPKLERELNFHFDGTSAKGLSLNGFYGKRNEKVGTTIFAAYQSNSAYDPANIDLSAIPKYKRYSLNPKFFFYPTEKTKLMIGLNSTFEDRIGGDMHYIGGSEDPLHSYFEQNKTERMSSQIALDHDFGKCSHVTFKNSIGYFNRRLNTPGYVFDGTQYSSFTEANYASHGDKLEWIAGANLWTDSFKERNTTSALRNYNQTTFGAFVQNTFKANDWLHFETGFRTDHVVYYGTAFLPRLSTLFKFTDKFTSRLGGGLGYKAPTLFTEDSERLQYQNILGLNSQANKLEKSFGLNLDFNYRTNIFDDKVSFTINHLFFLTRINDPLQLLPTTTGAYQFVNVAGNIETKGTETNVKLGYKDFKLFLGYTYTDAHRHEGALRLDNPLTAKHRINSVIMYEVHDEWKVGLEAYTFSKQLLNDGSYGKNYTIMGFMVEKLWERFSVYVNFENFTDSRQTRFDNIYTGTVSNPQFRDIYAPLDGFVFNGGIKFKL